MYEHDPLRCASRVPHAVVLHERFGAVRREPRGSGGAGGGGPVGEVGEGSMLLQQWSDVGGSGTVSVVQREVIKLDVLDLQARERACDEQQGN